MNLPMKYPDIKFGIENDEQKLESMVEIKKNKEKKKTKKKKKMEKGGRVEGVRWNVLSESRSTRNCRLAR